MKYSTVLTGLLFAALVMPQLSAGELTPTPAPAKVQHAVTATHEQSEDERLARFFEGIFERNLARSPVLQAEFGIKSADYGKWDDFSDSEAIRRNEQTRADLERLRAEFDYDVLNERLKVSYRIFEFLSERELRDFPWRFHAYAFSTMRNAATFRVTFLQNIHRVDTLSDAEDYISRLVGLETVYAQLVDSIDMAAKRGIVPTSFSFDPVLHDTRALLAGTPFDDSGRDSPLLADFRGKVAALNIPAAERDRLVNEAIGALNGPFKRGIEAFIVKVETLREKSHGPHGVWKLPDGAGYYSNRVEFWTTVPDLTPDEIHAIGLAEVARIRKEMTSIVKEIGFAGDVNAFFEFLRIDPDNVYPNTEEGRQAYLEQSRTYIDAMYEDVGETFARLPKTPLEVRRVEEWREATSSFAFYARPSPDGSRPGIYYVNLRNMADRKKQEMETLAYHEGVPGHHFQIAIQQELDGVPEFQKSAFFGAYAEGWACYAELLAKEQGRFADPMQNFGRLQFDMLRASRLVVDIGAHSRKWTRERMIDFMLANNPMTREDAVKEVERYLDLPGQALSYKIGTMKILELREKARQELGVQFDIRDFHDVVLRNGAVALPILEELIEAYIMEKRLP